VAAKDAGFDIMLTANNHALDRGAKGVKRTIAVLDSLGFKMLGTYLNDSLRKLNHPLFVEKNNIRIALLNYTYGTNGLTVEPPYCVNRIDTAQIRKDLLKAREGNAEYTIVTIHWGNEYERTESKQQQQLTQFMFRNGADAIIGSHPHVVQPARMLEITFGDTSHFRPVFYSLGNFVSNQRAQYKDGGIMAELHLHKTHHKVVLDSVAYLPYWVYREDRNLKSTFYVIPVSKYECDSSLIKFDTNNQWRFNRFVNDTRSHMSGFPESGFYRNNNAYRKPE
jgi:poly-gamma-glutamate synthesis protein (capsule biosynthesis protein)